MGEKFVKFICTSLYFTKLFRSTVMIYYKYLNLHNKKRMLTKTIFLCTLSHYIVRHEVLFQWRWLWVLGHSATFHVGSESRIYGSNNERSGQVILRIIAQVARKRFGCNDDCWRQFRFRPRVVGIAWLQSGGLRQYLPEHQSPFPFCECFVLLFHYYTILFFRFFLFIVLIIIFKQSGIVFFK